MARKYAYDLNPGDVFRLDIYGEVIAATSAADGKRVELTIKLEDANRGIHTLEFAAGHVLACSCRPSRDLRVVHVEHPDDPDDPAHQLMNKGDAA